MEIRRLVRWLVSVLATIAVSNMLLEGSFGYEQSSEQQERGGGRWKGMDEKRAGSFAGKHIRQKRLLWITTDGRLALPPGTHLTITPSLSLPFVRYPPDGFLSNMSISLPFSIDFDSLGLTDNQNPYGVLPPLLGRNLGRKAGSYFADYVAQFLERKRNPRSAPPPPPILLPKQPLFHGGERALLYAVVEDLLTSFGMDGKECLLRAICEVHSRTHSTIQKYGLVGEIMHLFFSASKSPFANLMTEYVEAEKTGMEKKECWPYFKNCQKSLFRSFHNKYTTDSDDELDESINDGDEEDINEINVDDESADEKSNWMM